jgi:diguanylate cyclase (GGDEF)-like protein
VLRRRRDEALAIERAAFATARALFDAASSSTEAVYHALETALREALPRLEAVSLWRAEGDRFDCAFAGRGRFERYAGSSLPALDPQSPLAAVRCDGGVHWVEPPLRPLHPADRHALAAPLGEDMVLYVALAARAARHELHAALERGALTAAALRIARERDLDRARATYDGLTGLLTPRAFRLELARRLRTHATARRVALVFVDTDRFKDWNDRYGHAAGDRLLCELAAVLQRHADGPDDMVARNGGDEFCLVWSRCEKSAAILRAETLRRSVAEAFAGQGIPITVSLGVAAYPADAAEAEMLLEAADKAMYASKAAGRDRVSFPDGNGALRTVAQ